MRHRVILKGKAWVDVDGEVLAMFTTEQSASVAYDCLIRGQEDFETEEFFLDACRMGS